MNECYSNASQNDLKSPKVKKTLQSPKKNYFQILFNKLFGVVPLKSNNHDNDNSEIFNCIRWTLPETPPRQEVYESLSPHPLPDTRDTTPSFNRSTIFNILKNLFY